jgi:hypothetical protein
LINKSSKTSKDQKLFSERGYMYVCGGPLSKYFKIGIIKFQIKIGIVKMIL